MISPNKKVASLLAALAIAGFGASAVLAGEDGAKGLFFEQLESPTKAMNTGVQYSIELIRDGKKTRVTNKHGFQNGDKIRFHLKANIDGYAYVLLKNGSRGEQSVLFPNSGDDNKVKRGDDYIIPSDGFLTFDENPGTEKVSLVLSRMPIDAQAYLTTPKEAPTLIASASTGSKDLIPSRVLVHYSDAPAPPVKIASNPRIEPKIESTTKPQAPKTSKPATRIVASNKKNEPKPVAKADKRKTGRDDDGMVTVVSELPGNVLHVDVDLHHI
jgi:hypothetical protein